MDHPVSEYLCRWNIPGWNNLRQCFVDAVCSDHFICTWDSAGVEKSYHVWFPDGSAKKQPDKTTLRWIKLLKRALRLGSKVVLLGDLVTCGSENDVGCVQLQLTARNAIMMSGQCSMSGDQARIFEFCCGGFKGWTRAMDILTKHEHLNLQSLGGVDNDPTCVSAPCQSFTTTGNNQGWEHALGVVLVKAITCAAIMETEMIALENSAQMYRNSVYYGCGCITEQLMQHFKDIMILIAAQPPQPNAQPGRKDRDRVGRSRSPKVN